MGCTVFANGMEIACKVSGGKTTAAMPDVCLSPPTPPAGPVPIPYPNTAMASDTDNGSKTVQIGGDEVMLKDQSCFKKSTGDEAATKSLGMGVVSHQIQGTVAFVAWSMDVKFEGANVPRHLDLTLHNGASDPYDTPPWPFMASMKSNVDPCANEKEAEQQACGSKSDEQACKDSNCQAARKCRLVKYGASGSPNCCKDPDQTGHHMVEDHWVQGNSNFPMAQGDAGKNAAPTVCCEGSRYDNQHGIMHSIQGIYEDSFLRGVNAGKKWTYATGKKATLRAHSIAFSGSDCSSKCLGAQLDTFYGKDTNPSRDLNQPTQRQALGRTEGPDQLTRSQAEQFVDMWFGGARL